MTVEQLLEEQSFIKPKRLSNNEFYDEYAKGNTPEEKHAIMVKHLKDRLSMGVGIYKSTINSIGRKIDRDLLHRAKEEATGKKIKGTDLNAKFLREYNLKPDDQKLSFLINFLNNQKERKGHYYYNTLQYLSGKINTDIEVKAKQATYTKSTAGLSFFNEYNKLQTKEKKVDFLIKYLKERRKQGSILYYNSRARLKKKIDKEIFKEVESVLNKEGLVIAQRGNKAETNSLGIASKNQEGVITRTGISAKKGKHRVAGLKKALIVGDDKKIYQETIKTLENSDFIKDDILLKRANRPNKNVFIEVKDNKGSGEIIDVVQSGGKGEILELKYCDFLRITRSTKQGKEEDESFKDYNQKMNEIVSNHIDELNAKLDVIIKNQIESAHNGSRTMLAIHDVEGGRDIIFWVNLRKKKDDIKFYFKESRRGKSYGLGIFMDIHNLTKKELFPLREIQDKVGFVREEIKRKHQ